MGTVSRYRIGMFAEKLNKTVETEKIYSGTKSKVRKNKTYTV